MRQPRRQLPGHGHDLLRPQHHRRALARRTGAYSGGGVVLCAAEGSVEGGGGGEVAFAWTKTDDVPLLLGQTNFFLEFDVFFSRSAMFFEVMPKGTSF